MNFLKKIVFGIVNIVTIPQVFAVSIQHSPIRSAVPKNAIQIEFFATQMNKITFASLNARTTTTTSYVRLPMIGSGRVYKGEIPAYLVQKIGVEYYIEATTNDGQKITYPANNPATNPVKVNMTSNSVSPVVRVISPLPDQVVSTKRPPVSVSFKNFINPIDKSSVKIYLDGTDVSANAKIKGTFAQYRPPFPMSKGKHKLKVVVKDITGTGATPQEWIFYVLTKGIDSKNKKKKEKKEWKTTGNISSNFTWSKMISNGGPNNVANPNGYSTATIDFKASSETSEITLGPLFFTTQETNDQQPAQNFTFAYNNSFLETKWGTVSSQLTSMSGGGGQVHGGELVLYSANKKNKEGFRFQVAGGRTRQAVKASEATFGVGTYSQRIFSGKVDYFASKKLEIYTAAMDVRDIEDSIAISERGDVEPLENQAGAIGFKGKIPIFILDNWEGEVGYSFAKIKNPEDTTLVEKFQDFAFKFSGGKNITALKTNLKFDYSHYRPNFLFLFGGAGSDSQQLGVNLTNSMFTSFKPNIAYKWQTDNLEQQKDATTQNHTLSLSTSLNIAKIPAISISASGSLQTSVPKDPLKVSLQSENKNYTLALSTSFNYSIFGTSTASPLSLSFNRTNSINSGGETLTDAYTASTGMNMSNVFKFLTIALTASLNATPNTQEGAEKAWNFSDNTSLNLTPTIAALGISIPIGLTMARTYEYNLPADKDKTTDNINIGVTVALSYAIFKVHKVSLSGGFTKYIDNINSDSNYKQYSLSVSYNYSF